MSEILVGPWWLITLAALGLVFIAVFVILPFIWMVTYAFCYTAFEVWTCSWERIKNKPVRFLGYVLWTAPIKGFKEAITWPVSSKTCGPYKWKPLFGFSKSED